MNWEKIGLKAGIEIHQRLDTEHKLFCNCPTELSDSTVSEVTRRQRPIAGELGEVDPATIYEYSKNRQFNYKITDKNCLIESDSDFPLPIDKEALNISLKIAKMLNMKIPDLLQVMRKIVTDGSNTTGYQKTVLVGLGTEKSVIETKQGSVRVKDLELEEESAGIVGEKNGKTVFSLDRLGIPLVEIGTEPDITTPEQAKETAEQLGRMLRTLPVKRGIGTIRQDVNVSIKGGARVEIKGFQDLKNLPDLVRNEANRQLALLELKKEIKKRGGKLGKPKKVTEIFTGTKCKFIKKILSKNGLVKALKLQNFSGLLKKDCGGKTLGKELAHYVQPFGPQGIVHSDEQLDSYKLTKEFEQLAKELNAKKSDLILILAHSNEIQLGKAMDALVERLKLLSKKIPEETRIALPDATTKYSRPLPGAGRMYPETDLPTIKVDRKQLKKLKLPKSLSKQKKQLEKELPKELVQQLIKSRQLAKYKKLKKYGPKIVADTLLSTLKNLKREGVDVEKIKDNKLEKIFKLVKNKKLPKSRITEALEMLTKGSSIEKIKKKYKPISSKELKKIVQKVKKNNPGLSQKALIGMIMKKTKGRVSGKEVAEMLEK